MLPVMTLILRTAVATDVGLGRTNNEDAAFAGRRLVAVADGIGGMPAGELASDIAVQALSVLEHYPGAPDPVPLLRLIAETANRRIREKTESEELHDGMGTTLTALMLSGDRLGLLNVGDSRCYRLRDGELTQLTRDDTFVQSLVDEGLLTVDEARVHPRRSVVTQALQGLDYVPTCETLEARVKDRYLVCTDGLSDIVADADIAATLRTVEDRNECAARLIQLALEAGAPDNVTVVIADVVDE